MPSEQDTLLPMAGKKVAGTRGPKPRSRGIFFLACEVHSSFTPVACDLAARPVLTVALGTEEHKVYVRKRPGLEEFMNTVSKLFEVAVFTASTALYAAGSPDVPWEL
ncbi:unnamed protein product [Effrenium voratum]|nr:unnamed protein product [Effrenium voratum]